METAKRRLKTSVSQAKNVMRRVVAEIVDGSPTDIGPVWDYFGDQCAYCGDALNRDARAGHMDHLVSGGGNHLGNLVLSCGACNGDDKRDRDWLEVLRLKSPDDDAFARREARIEEWVASHPARNSATSEDIERVTSEIEQLLDDFSSKCAELRRLVAAASN